MIISCLLKKQQHNYKHAQIVEFETSINKNLSIDLSFSFLQKKTSKRSSKCGHRPTLEYENATRNDAYTKIAKL